MKRPKIQRKLIIDLDELLEEKSTDLLSKEQIRNQATKWVREEKEHELWESLGGPYMRDWDDLSQDEKDSVVLNEKDIDAQVESIQEDQEYTQKEIQQIQKIAKECSEQPIVIKDPATLLTREQTWDHRDLESYLLFHHILYSFSGPFTLDEFKLACLQEFDREREYFEGLKNRFSDPDEAQAEAKGRKRRKISEKVRRYVWRRDGGKCVSCGSRERLEYDHIIPVSKGGGNTARNIELLCEECNRSKGDSIS